MTTKILVISILLTFGMLGCANVVSVKETYTSDGQKGYVIDCSGDSDYHLVMHNPTMADCQTKAGEICGDRGYEIIERSDDAGNEQASTAFGVTKIFRHMVIQCNEKKED